MANGLVRRPPWVSKMGSWDHCMLCDKHAVYDHLCTPKHQAKVLNHIESQASVAASLNQIERQALLAVPPPPTPPADEAPPPLPAEESPPAPPSRPTLPCTHLADLNAEDFMEALSSNLVPTGSITMTRSESCPRIEEDSVAVPPPTKIQLEQQRQERLKMTRIANVPGRVEPTPDATPPPLPADESPPPLQHQYIVTGMGKVYRNGIYLPGAEVYYDDEGCGRVLPGDEDG